jgi:hypothetical protein
VLSPERSAPRDCTRSTNSILQVNEAQEICLASTTDASKLVSGHHNDSVNSPEQIAGPTGRLSEYEKEMEDGSSRWMYFLHGVPPR